MADAPTGRGARGARARTAAIAGAATLAVGGLAACTGGTGGANGAGDGDARSDVGVQMFQWTWDSIAQECTDTLGPAGYGWVLTSPPQEHILGEEWWTSYQPVSYRVESRLGTREQFEAMTAACREAGVDVVADAVINHMTGSDTGGTGWAGSSYEHYDYPGIYTTGDFHHCGLTPSDDIVSYGDAAQVQTCELLNLADLDTSSEKVQDTLRAYLQDLLDLGVAGFRIDAAKHIAPEDLAAILDPFPDDTIVRQEVIGASGEPVQPAQYTGTGQVFDFVYARALTAAVRSGDLAGVLDLPTSTGLSSNQAVVFVDNHDTERNGETLSRSYGDQYALATTLLLAAPYGTPVVLSSYAFGITDPNLGPAQDSTGAVLDAACPDEVGPGVAYPDQTWVCQHRWDAVVGMVNWRIAAGDAPAEEITAMDDGVLSFRRGDAWVVLNVTREPVSFGLETALEPGEYCDVVSGLLVDGACAGGTVEVHDDGVASLVVPAQGAVAFHPGQRVSG
ncbi:alpha-amylase [Miniimonas arenae]|uniref:alpha-amylase n=1 Tax=Miniimonas arenae TaxID=676201 RepID=UPI0015D6443A|nr:alpha-amylase family protein [Miniimonas arenae]